MKIYLCLFVLILFSVSCMSTPKLVPNPVKDEPLTDLRFYKGIGVASGRGNPEDNWHAAEQDALAKIAAQIGAVQIAQILVGNKVEVNTDIASRFEQFTKSVLNELIPNVQFTKRHYDPIAHEYWVLAVVEKSRVEELAQQRLEKSQAVIGSHHKSANQFISSGKMIYALRELANALKEANQSYMTFIQMDINDDGNKEYASDFIQSQIKILISKITLMVSGGNNQTGETTKPLSEPLQIKLLYANADKEVPISEAKILFRFIKGTGDLDESAITDQDGIARSRVHQIRSVGANIVEAKLDTTAFSDFPGLEDKNVRFEFKAEESATKLRIAVGVLEVGSDPSSRIVEPIIISTLTEKGLKVQQMRMPSPQIEAALQGGIPSNIKLSDIDLLIVGKAEANYSSNALGYAIVYTARVVIKGIYLKSEEKFEIVVPETDKQGKPDVDVRGFGNTEAKARVQALQKAGTGASEKLLVRLKLPSLP